MRRVPPSMLVHEELEQLLHGEHGESTNVISTLVDVISRLVIQELLEGEQADYLDGRGRYERRRDDQAGWRNGYEPGRVRTAEGAIKVRVPQVRGAAEPYRSGLMSFLEGNSEVLDRLVTEMYARGLSTRDVEDAFRDATGELHIEACGL
jgi:putative transposase